MYQVIFWHCSYAHAQRAETDLTYPLLLLGWVDFSDFVEVLQGAKKSFDVTIYLSDLSGSIVASVTLRFHLKHHQMSNLKPGLWKLDLIYWLPRYINSPFELGNVIQQLVVFGWNNMWCDIWFQNQMRDFFKY